MTRLHDAFDVLVDRGDPVGSDILLARARDAVANGTVAELQLAATGKRLSFRVAAAAAVCVVILAVSIAVVARDRAPVTTGVPTQLHCGVTLGSQTKTSVLRLANHSRTSLGIGLYTATVSIVMAPNGSGTIRAELSGPTLTGTSWFGPFRRTQVQGVGIFGSSTTPDGYFHLDCGTPAALALNKRSPLKP